MAVLALDSQGNLQRPARFVFGVEAVRVRLLVRLRTVLGEWLTDADRGLPWGDWIGPRKAPTPTVVAAMVRLQVSSVPGVLDVLACDGSRTGATSMRLRLVLRVSEDDQEGVLDLSSDFDPWATTPAHSWYVLPPGVL